MAGNVAPKISTNGLVLYLDAVNRNSYVSGSTTWRDLTSGANNGTLVNGPIFNSSNGGSIVFDGNDDYVNCGNNSSIQIIGNMTILSWIKVTNFSGFRGILGKTTTGGQPASYDYYIVQTTGTPRFFRGNGVSSAGNVDGTNAIATDTWQHVSVTMAGTLVTHYLNGQTNGTGNITAAIGNGTDNLIIGSRTDFVTDFLGNISQVQIYNRALSDAEILQNYNATKSRYPITPDADAQAFITAAGITNSTQQSAINTLVTSLKGYGIWTKMKAIYPMVGGTETAHKFNLKNPADTNAAFRLLFTGTWVHSATGAKPNGITGYADTFLVPNTDLTLNGAGISYYAREVKSVSINKGALMGAGTGTSEISFFVDYNDSKDYIANNNAETTGVLLLGRTGLFHNTRISSTGYKVYNNGTINYNITSTSVGTTTSGIQIARVNGYGDLTDVECAFAAIDIGLTDTEAANLYTAVQAFQTALGRQV